MDYLYERVAYLRGLAEGLEIEEKSKEGKLLGHIIDALEDFADAISDLNEEQEELNEYVDFIDEDLADVEEEVFGEFDDEFDDEYDDEFDDEDDIDYVEVECPYCKEIVYLDSELVSDDGKIECPNCQRLISCECGSGCDCE
ncbi:CD1247 N-terminal domain-containing protein [Proteiniborus sp. MB09-C3]|uniref:CD1247 N-terminal domain-containing protein n=1 Tax=Proteiniborus sp. MB09-C3 TaxID=3050072 RepID=UPI0025548F89|nr:CD1247 N-terminal domain-containing protein [Proteiniborus sp. MB09-C3]WIV11005.1 zinc ribbon domain-containing protein [Proteiniborus sp. MB09-C3]